MMTQMQDIEKQPAPRSFLWPLSFIAMGFALCGWLALRAGRIDSDLPSLPPSSTSETEGLESLLADFPPRPELSPKDVVQLQMDAVRAARDDERQIVGCYAFASPSNRISIGSPEQLLALIRANYSPMLSGELFEVGEAQVVDRAAAVEVTLTAHDKAKHVYGFFLSRQVEAPYEDCWMTDAVVELKAAADPQGAPVEAPAKDGRNLETGVGI